MAAKHRYVPIIRWRQGERNALAQLSTLARPGVTPLVILLTEHFKPPSATASAARKGPKNEAEQFIKLAQDAHPKADIFVDAAALPGTPKHHSLDDIATAARAAGAAFLPAAALNAPSDYWAAVTRVVSKSGQGMALRVSFSQMNNASAWVATLPLAPRYIDLVVDLGSSISDVASLGGAVAKSFGALHQAKAWRSVTMAGGCIPENLGGLVRGPSTLPREELLLWRSLTAAGLPYKLDFGDYGTVWPGAPVSVPASPPINAKYSLADEFLIIRGVKYTGAAAQPMDKQFRAHSRIIRGYVGRGALAHCWADGMIDSYAASTSGPCGNPKSWIGISMNRHIEVTRHHLP